MGVKSEGSANFLWEASAHQAERPKSWLKTDFFAQGGGSSLPGEAPQEKSVRRLAETHRERRQAGTRAGAPACPAERGGQGAAEWWVA